MEIGARCMDGGFQRWRRFHRWGGFPRCLIGVGKGLSVFQVVGAWEGGRRWCHCWQWEEGDCYGKGGVVVFLRFFLLSFFFFKFILLIARFRF